MPLPWSVNTLSKNWAPIERAGLPSFIVRYGILRFAPLISMIGLMTRINRPMPWTAMVLPALIVPAVMGSLWAIVTWDACKKQSRATPNS